MECVQEILKRLERSVTDGEANLSVARFKEAGVATKSILLLIRWKKYCTRIVLPVTLENRIALLPVAVILAVNTRNLQLKNHKV